MSRDKATNNRLRRFHEGVSVVKDRRRIKIPLVPDGTSSTKVNADETGTIFPTKVVDPNEYEWVLKDGRNNSKIGGDVLCGYLKGARLFTLTLEERATCPTSCNHWRTCYGNNMPYAYRHRHGPLLEQTLEKEVELLCAEHPIVLVRLHMLGDFYSKEYVSLWNTLLRRHTELHIFGFTGWSEDTEIGGSIKAVREEHGSRFSIRHSGVTGKWGSFTIDFPTEKPRLGDAIVCPEQRDAMNGELSLRHCGSCGLCWKVSNSIVFVEH